MKTAGEIICKVEGRETETIAKCAYFPDAFVLYGYLRDMYTETRSSVETLILKDRNGVVACWHNPQYAEKGA